MKTFKQHIIFFIIFGVVVFFGLIPQYIRFPQLQMNLGGEPQTMRRLLDKPYLNGFWSPEPDPWISKTQTTYRWSMPQWQIHWPHFGSGWWITKININNPTGLDGVTRNLQFTIPPISNVQFTVETRTFHLLLLESNDDTPMVQAHIRALNSPNEERALGIISTQFQIFPTTLSHIDLLPRKLQFAAFLLLSVFFIFASKNGFQNHHWYVYLFLPFALMLWQISSPVWWAIHAQIIYFTALGLCLSILLISVLQKFTDISRRTVNLILLGLLITASQIILLLSPFLLSSDIRMHIRMFEQVNNGMLWLTAELPCEAGSTTVPYLPAVYLFLSPLRLLYNDSSWTASVFYICAVIFHSIAVIYLGFVLIRGKVPYTLVLFFVILASLSANWWASTHIGEMTNAWGHAIFIIAIGSWLDKSASIQQRIFWSSFVFLSHTGVSISYMFSVIGLIAYDIWTKKQLSWKVILLHMLIGSAVVFVFYSGFYSLLSQSSKYPNCPPNYPIIDRIYGQIGYMSIFFVALIIIMMIKSNNSYLSKVYLIAITCVFFSIMLLLFRDQTVRWSISFAPFVALAIAHIAYHIRGFGIAGKTLALTIITYFVYTFYQGTWDRIITYLH